MRARVQAPRLGQQHHAKRLGRDEARRAPRVVGGAERAEAAAGAGVARGQGIAAAALRALPPQQLPAAAGEDQHVIVVGRAGREAVGRERAHAQHVLRLVAPAVEEELVPDGVEAIDHGRVLERAGVALEDHLDVLPVALVVVDPLVERKEEPVLDREAAVGAVEPERVRVLGGREPPSARDRRPRSRASARASGCGRRRRPSRRRAHRPSIESRDPRRRWPAGRSTRCRPRLAAGRTTRSSSVRPPAPTVRACRSPPSLQA